MAVSETYVDPSIAGDSGAGTVGDPYGDLQYALDTMTRDATNGDRINIKAGTDEILSSALSLTTYGTPAANQPLVLQGYTSAAADGGQGGVDCNSNTMWSSSAYNYISMADLHIHGSGTNSLVNLNNEITLIDCEFSDKTGTATAVDLDSPSFVIGCYFHGVSGSKILEIWSGLIYRNRFDLTTTATTDAIFLLSTGCYVIENIISASGAATDGIVMSQAYQFAINNSIYNSGTGTAKGIDVDASSHNIVGVMNNLVEGYSGAGGTGIVATGDRYVLMGNAVYDCTTEYTKTGNHLLYNDLDNETLLASPFTTPGSDDFTPVDTGNVKEGSKPAKIGTQ